MKIKIAVVFIFLLAIIPAVIETVSSQNQPRLLSPLPDSVRANVLGAIKNPTQTPTPTPTLTPTPTPTPKPKPKPTSTPTPTPIIIAPPDLEALFAKYGEIYNVNKDLLKRIANCESKLNPNAGNEKYAGLFQFSKVLWIQTRSLMGQNSDLNLRFNPEEAIRTAAFMLSQNHLGIWPNCNK